MKPVLVAGSTNFDILAPVQRMPHEHEKLRCHRYVIAVGGSASNTARGIVSGGIPTHLVSAVGDDPFGEICLTKLARAGVNVDRVLKIADAATGLAVVFSSGNSKRMITFSGPDRDSAYNEISTDELAGLAHVHVTGEVSAGLINLVKRAHRANCSVSIEWNGRDMSQLAYRSTLNFMNADELYQLGDHHSVSIDEAARSLARQVDGSVLITRGADGALWVTSDGEVVQQHTTRVDPVDRTGGGDAFDAGVIVAFLNGADKLSCLRAGLDAAIGAIMILGE
jgi:sugar/nucleoside kinase (ribokinase family)